MGVNGGGAATSMSLSVTGGSHSPSWGVKHGKFSESIRLVANDGSRPGTQSPTLQAVPGKPENASTSSPPALGGA